MVRLLPLQSHKDQPAFDLIPDSAPSEFIGIALAGFLAPD